MTQPTIVNKYNIPNLAEFLARRMRDISSTINCHTVGEIVSFDPVNQTAVVQIKFLKVLRGVNPIGNSGQSSDEVVSYPQLVDVPVLILQGGGGSLTFPITPGDTGIVMFCDRDMDNWFNAGLMTVPNSNRIHDINDAVILIGINNLLTPIANYDPDNVVLQYPNGEVKIIDIHGERLADSGDVKASFRTANHSGWLVMDGHTIGDGSSGADYTGEAYRDLFDILKFASPNSGSEVFDDGDQVTIPDGRGRSLFGIDNMGGVSADVLTAAFNPNRNTLGGFIGEEAHQLTIAELAAHTHTYTYVIAPGAADSGGALDTYASTNTGSTGGDQAHQNTSTGLMIYWFVKL